MCDANATHPLADPFCGWEILITSSNILGGTVLAGAWSGVRL
jgi:hypothetical protein